MDIVLTQSDDKFFFVVAGISAQTPQSGGCLCVTTNNIIVHADGKLYTMMILYTCIFGFFSPKVVNL